PLKPITEPIKPHPIPSTLSNTPPTFLSNHILYHLPYLQPTPFPKIKFPFIHLPFLPQQLTHKPQKPSISLQTIPIPLYPPLQAILESPQ
ncbi:pyroglutamyl-peptidase I family protein, partial [Staphylococcus saprophyticus]